MNLQGTIRRILMEEFPQEDYSNQIIKNVSVIDSILKSLYPNFNKEGSHLKKRTPLFWNTPLYECFDNETHQIYGTYIPTKRELSINREIYMTLENYLNDYVATYIIDWFNIEFDTNAEYVTF
jgi:hypothetical protein